MKKLLLITAMLTGFLFVKAQNCLLLHIEDISPDQHLVLCFQDYDTVVIVDTTCESFYDFHWHVHSLTGYEICDEWGPVLTLIPDDEVNYQFSVQYQPCEGDLYWFSVLFSGFSSPAPWLPEYRWKHEDEMTTFTAPDNSIYYYTPYSFKYEWSTGESEREIEVADPGIYWSRLYNDCGEAFDSVEVRNGVEISYVSTDLATNLSQINWKVDEAQSAYLAEVNVYRNGQLVGTVPYSAGVFLDNIGSVATQWQYHVVGITAEGEKCPLPSYWVRTVHLDHLQGQDNHVLQWTSYEAENEASVVAYRIYDRIGDELQLIEEVGSFANVYNYNPEAFSGDAVVAAVLGSGELSYSNRVPTHLGLGEWSESRLSVYPNPAKGYITIEGKGVLNITNTLGQPILVREIDGKESVELPQGLYFVKLGGQTRKVVVE